MIKSPEPREFVDFVVRKNVTYLFKDFLTIVAEFQEEGLMDEEYFKKLRKKILDRGNDSIRDIITTLEKFEIKYK